MKKKTKFILIGSLLLVVMILASLSYQHLQQRNGDLIGIDLPTPPATSPIKNVNSDVMYKEKEWTTNFTHDGAILKTNDWYYVFSTDYMVGAPPIPGIQIRKSKDLIHWEFVGRVFDQVSKEAWEWTHGTTFWAPTVVEMNNKYYLYYSVSEVGKRNSYIGLATSDTIEGLWKDEGAVFKSKEGDANTVNAIDPDLTFDEQGHPWMVYGSYFGGIFITKVDKNTGKLANPDDEGTLIAQRKDMNFGIEGPEIIYNQNTGYYYLTVSYDWLEDSYNVRVARSKSITGPFLDYNENNMIDIGDDSFDTGNKLVGAYSFGKDPGWIGTGHNGLLQDGDDFYLIHNARAGEDKYWSHLHVRKMFWTEDGWPVVSPERYAGETEQKITESNIIGNWEQIILNRFDEGMQNSKKLHLLPNGKIKGHNDKSSWKLTGKNTLELSIYDPGVAPKDFWKYTVKVIPGWDWENWNGSLVFTGMNQEGTVIWGKKRIEK
ncbi:arabinan endo-1,5-alpha-L-arabinosidase [Bacillus sp. ISL-75]|uniref:arabinan endo-1,5-alpha-L-arabinosidase n=1 Tax=Bacillus sp. ISL-75 TaxID=2819137 RepID=UPI001BEB26CB|nr:arabinan endo-1,5-alpha-L-arabinosidase [Bacillus sp. ISL-75]MBT2727323.1 arabinan endo-1,5-alpha-L-arabinosidase [Bacillus sp. ISL-75]